MKVPRVAYANHMNVLCGAYRDGKEWLRLGYEWPDGIIWDDGLMIDMSVSTATDVSFSQGAGTPGLTEQKNTFEKAKRAGMEKMGYTEIDTEHGVAVDTDGEVHRMGQMGAKRIGSLAIGIGVVGIVLNQMADMDIVANSTGVIDVSNIFATAGSGLNLLVVGVIIAAAAVLLSLWSGF